jgi:drug/metabolite transporter (DMT)-like permease
LVQISVSFIPQVLFAAAPLGVSDVNASASYLAVIAIWATTPLAIKFSNDSTTPIAALGLRMLLAVACALPVVLLWRRRQFFQRAHIKSYAFGSIALFPNMALVYVAAKMIPSGIISVMFGLSPFVTGMLAQWLLGERFFTWQKVVAQLLALAGLGVIFYGQWQLGGEGLVGLLIMLVSVVLYSYSLVAVKQQAMHCTVPAFEQTAGAMLFSLPGILITWLLVDGQFSLDLSAKSAWSIVYLATVGSLLGFVAFYHVLSSLGVSAAAIIPMITPVLALWAGAVFADETITPAIVLGSAMIIFGLAYFEGLGRWRKLFKKVSTN